MATAFAVNRFSNRVKDYLARIQDPVSFEGASLTWNELTIAQAYVLICMSGKSKRPSDLVGPYANFEQPALSYAASLIDLVAERRLQFKRANGRTCINIVNKQLVGNFLDNGLFEALMVRERANEGRPSPLKDMVLYSTYAEYEVDPHVVAIMRSLEAQDLVSPRLRNTFWYTYPTWQMVDERLQVGLLQELKRLLSLHANPDEIPLFFRILLGLLFLEYQSTRKGGPFATNPFVRYGLCTKNEMKAYVPMLQACVYEVGSREPQPEHQRDGDTAGPVARVLSAPASLAEAMPSTVAGTRAWLRSWWKGTQTGSVSSMTHPPHIEGIGPNHHWDDSGSEDEDAGLLSSGAAADW